MTFLEEEEEEEVTTVHSEALGNLWTTVLVKVKQVSNNTLLLLLCFYQFLQKHYRKAQIYLGEKQNKIQNLLALKLWELNF